MLLLKYFHKETFHRVVLALISLNALDNTHAEYIIFNRTTHAKSMRVSVPVRRACGLVIVRT